MPLNRQEAKDATDLLIIPEVNAAKHRAANHMIIDAAFDAAAGAGGGTLELVSVTIATGGTHTPGETLTHGSLSGKTILHLQVNETLVKRSSFSLAGSTITRTDQDFADGDEVTISCF